MFLLEGYDPVKETKISLDDYHILALPGGFSCGDYIAAGKVLARYLMEFLGEAVNAFVAKGKPVIGICNGFQVQVSEDELSVYVLEHLWNRTFGRFLIYFAQ